MYTNLSTKLTIYIGVIMWILALCIFEIYPMEGQMLQDLSCYLEDTDHRTLPTWTSIISLIIILALISLMLQTVILCRQCCVSTRARAMHWLWSPVASRARIKLSAWSGLLFLTAIPSQTNHRIINFIILLINVNKHSTTSCHIMTNLKHIPTFN